MIEELAQSPNSTFVVRFWQTWSDTGPVWLGRIEHIQSGEHTIFRDLQEMLAFIRRFGVMEDENNLKKGGRL